MPVETTIETTDDIAVLRAVMTRLRDPEAGCPWDTAQTFRTIAPYTIEEAYEVADAIDRDDLPALRDELGDLLLQVVFHAEMARECGAFDFDDVVQSIIAKMHRRHPHVFGGSSESDLVVLDQSGSTTRPASARRRLTAIPRPARLPGSHVRCPP